MRTFVAAVCVGIVRVLDWLLPEPDDDLTAVASAAGVLTSDDWRLWEREMAGQR